MSRMARRWSREDGDETSTESIPELDATAGEIDESPADVEEASTEVEEGQDVIDEGEAAVAEAEQVEATLEEAVDNGTELSEGDANLLEIQTESIRRRLGLTSYHSGRITTESLMRKRDGRERTRIALESIGDTLGNAWEKIKAWFKKLWTSLKNFYKSIFDANYKLIKRAEALKNKKFGPKDGDNTDDIEDGSIYAGFAFDGKFEISNISTILANHTSLVENIRTLTDKSAESVKNAKTDPNGVSAKFIKAFSEVEGWKDGSKTDVSKYDGVNDTEIKEAAISSHLVDGMKMGIYTIEEADYGSKEGGKVMVKGMRFFHSTNPDAEEDDSKTVEPANVGQCRTICTEVMALGRAMEALAKNEKKIDSIASALDAEFDRFSKLKKEDKDKAIEGTAEEDGPGKKYNKKANVASTGSGQTLVEGHTGVSMVKSVGSVIVATNTAALKYGYKAGVKALNYVAKCQSKFKAA